VQRVRTQYRALSVAALRRISTCYLLFMRTKYEEITDMNIKKRTFQHRSSMTLSMPSSHSSPFPLTLVMSDIGFINQLHQQGHFYHPSRLVWHKRY
jgi:hypothetical protein